MKGSIDERHEGVNPLMNPMRTVADTRISILPEFIDHIYDPESDDSVLEHSHKELAIQRCM
jgi:hypothetical protein